MAQNYYLMHHGIKGMKWGVRRTPEQLGHKTKKAKIDSYSSAGYDSHGNRNYESNSPSKTAYKRAEDKAIKILDKEYPNWRKDKNAQEILESVMIDFLEEDELGHSELYHHGIKGMKWGVRRTPAQLGHKPSIGTRAKTKLNDPEFQRKAAKAAKIALAVGAMYAGHKVLNNPEAIEAGKKVLSNVIAAKGTVKASAIKAITNSSEFKIAKAAGKAGLEGGKKALKFVGSDNFRKTASGIGAVASTAGVLRKQIKDLKNKPEGDTVDKALGYAKKGSAIGESLNTLARAGSSSSSESSSGNKSVGKDVTDRIGKPSNRGIDKSSQAYQNLFKNRDADTRSTIKSLANAGYDVDQIRKYLEHSAIDGSMIYRGWSFNPMAGCRYIF